ncbi:MAG: DUF4235 domain-containing protein [Actinomycetales bacterium]|nr:DUF4235 domain-containing protein [Actinomycetales bacterium]
MNERTQELLIKGAGTVTALAAAWLVQRAISAVWKAARGHDLPTGKDDTDEAVGEVVAAAVVTGALGALVRVLATRGGTKAARRILAR